VSRADGERREHREWKTDVDLSSPRNAPAQGRGGLQEGRAQVHAAPGCQAEGPGQRLMTGAGTTVVVS